MTYGAWRSEECLCEVLHIPENGGYVRDIKLVFRLRTQVQSKVYLIVLGVCIVIRLA